MGHALSSNESIGPDTFYTYSECRSHSWGPLHSITQENKRSRLSLQPDEGW